MKGSPSDQAPFSPSPSSRIAHYEILGALGDGGMGKVFRARDVNLGREVALKCPRPELASDAGGRHRFLREARVASALSHPHIVPVFEVFEHEGTPWLAMELVEGASLRALLNDRRILPIEEILQHSMGLAEALQAAHARSILHRDITPRNILIGLDGRARLADFGLARPYVAPGEESSASTRSPASTEPGGVVGTPGYMSPEQALGRKVDPRSDIFSLGSVLYEMCVGRPAFTGSGKGDLLDAVLHREPEAISRFNYELPAEMERIVRKCLAKRPEERYQDAGDLLSDLRALRRKLQVSEMLNERPAPGSRQWKPFRLAIVGACAVVLAVAALALWPKKPPTPPISPPDTRAVVAVLPFEDRTAEIDGDLRGQMIADLLGADLAESRRLRSLGSERVRAILSDLRPESTTAEKMKHVGDAADVDWLVAGYLYKEAGNDLAAVSVFVPGSAEPRESFRLSAARPAALAYLAAARLRELLSPGGNPSEERNTDTTDVSYPSEEARLLAFQGRVALEERRYEQAIASLEKAITIEPGFTTATGSLAEALHRAGYGRRAREAADRATRLVETTNSAPAGRVALEVRATRSRILADVPSEILARRALAERYPDEPETLLGLAEAIDLGGKMDEAFEIAERALALDPKSPRGKLQRARLLGRMKRYEDAQAALEESRRLFSALSSDGGLALVEQSRGDLEFGRQAYPEAARAYHAAAEIYLGAGLRTRAAESKKSEGDAELRQGNLAAARAHYEEAVAQARIAGDHRLIVRALGSLGGEMYLKGDYPNGEKTLRQAMDEARLLDNSQLMLVPLINLAGLLNYTGRVGEGYGLAVEAARVARERGDRAREAVALSLMADANYQQGHLKEAVQLYSDLVRLERAEGGSKPNLARYLSSLASILGASAPSREALEAASEAVEVDRALGSRADLAYALVIRARLRGETGMWDEAGADLQEAERIAGSEKETMQNVLDSAVLVHGLIAMMRGAWTDAEHHLEKVRRAGDSSGAVGLEVPALTALSRIAILRKDASKGKSFARKAVDHPKAQGDERTAARAALAAALAASGETAAASAEARRALDEAGSMNLPLVAARAALVLVSLPAAQHSPDREAIATRGRKALMEYLDAVPEDRRAAVRSRRDMEELFAKLDVGSAREMVDSN